MTESKICEEMIKYFGTDRRRINHFMKVYTIAVTIAQQEGLPLSELEVLKTAALMHDIGIKISEQKYGSSSGKYQELEGPAEAEKLLDRLGAEESLKDRVCWLIGHHHTYNMIDAPDFQILVEADLIVNLDEEQTDALGIKTARDKIFKTETGKKLLNSMFFGIFN